MDSEYIRVLTLYQPWASFIADGLKTIETRLHNKFACLKGQRIAIHAGKKWDPDAFEIFERPEFGKRGLYKDAARRLYWKNNIPLGAVLCTVMVQDSRICTPADSVAACIEIEPGDRRYGLVLRDLEVLDPAISLPGSQGIWKLDRSIFTRKYDCKIAQQQQTMF